MTTPASGNPVLNRGWAVPAIIAVLAIYAGSFAWGLPQRWTAAVTAGHAEQFEHGVEPPASEREGHAAELHEAGDPPPIWTITPFALLLAAIALLPLIPFTERWWESNLSRFIVSAGLAAVALAYYAFLHKDAIEAHWPGHSVVEAIEGPIQYGFVQAILANAILQEYIPFIVLLFSLYTIAGGIRISGDLLATPSVNAGIMAVGGLLASFIGTTGAAMLLIRLLLETNSERKNVAHTVVFYIFIVCNCGGCLLPIGDPPLFLGYLQGVSFTWTLSLWPEWLFVNCALLIVYWLVDRFYFYPHETISDVRRDIRQHRRLHVQGMAINGLLLVGVILAVAFLDPSKTLPGTDWHPWMYLREAVQLGLVALSLTLGPRQPRADNGFNYGAIIEVAALFIGIFICMQPALQILSANGAYLVERFDMGPSKFFWATGLLSSFLDNAPTYLVFFQTAYDPELAARPTAGVPELILVGISLGAVFMGAMTYIGNGPNFMVKAIAEKSGVRMPSFFGYMAYSILVLLPILGVMNWLYFLRPH